MFDRIDIQRIAAAAAGAVILATTFILGAAGPVSAAGPKAERTIISCPAAILLAR